MKRALSFFTLYLLVLQVVFAQTTSLRRVRIEPAAGKPGTPYEVLALRNLSMYPLTGTGPSSWTAAIASGQISLTVLSSGCLIAQGTVPPTVAPTCTTIPTTTTQIVTTPAYSQSVAGPADRMIYTVASGQNPTSTTLAFTGAPKTAADYSYSLIYQTNEGTGTGQGGISVNSSGVQSTFTTEIASGGTRTVTGVLSLTEGSNTVTFTNVSGSFPYQVRSLAIARSASTTTIVTSGTTTSGSSTTASMFSRVFVMGNSITTNWATSDNTKGLDASTPENDYYHKLSGFIKAANPSADIRQFPSWSSIGPDCGGLKLDASDGPYWEQHYWSLPGSAVYCGFTGADSLDRYNLVADWKPTMIVIRIGENVTALNHNYEYHLKRLIDKFKSKNSSAVVVLTTSVWEGLNQTQADLSTIVRSVGTQRGYPVADLAGITGATSGTLSHPNDAAMQVIAERIWATMSGSVNSVTATAPNKPAFYTFNYLPLTTNSTWPAYDNRKFNGVDEVGYKVVMDNGQVRAEIWKNWGGSVAHISVSGTGINLINQNKDKGRGNDLTFYRGGRTRQVESQNKEIHTGWASAEGGGVGNNPIGIGDVFDYSSEVVAMGRNDTMTYVKTRLYNWAVKNDPTDMYLERWVTLSGKEVKVRWKVTANRENDKTPYEARSQEMPNLYVNAPWHTAAYVGSDGAIHYLSGGNQQPFSIKEPWVAMVNGTSSSATGIGLSRSGMYRINQKDIALNEGGSTEFNNSSGYTNAEQHLQIDWNGQYYGDHSFYVGSVSEIRTWANAKPNPRNKLSWKFNSTNGRGYFWYHNAHDTGYPTPDSGVEIVSDVSGFFDINWPDVSIAASSITNLYMRYKAAPGYPTSATIVVGQPGEDPTTEAAHWKAFSLTCDNDWHTVIIPVSGVPGYGGIISRLRMTGYGANNSSKFIISWINTSDAEPTENGLHLLITLGIALGMARQRGKHLGILLLLASCEQKESTPTPRVMQPFDQKQEPDWAKVAEEVGIGGTPYLPGCCGSILDTTAMQNWIKLKE